MLKLNEEELSLLEDVDRRRVFYSKGHYFRTGQQNVTAAVQRLRAMKLVVLESPSGRVPPSRMCELTENGKNMIQGAVA
jgi:hypothetical protein